MTDEKVLFVSFSHANGFGNIIIRDFSVFDTEVWGALENQAICSYVIDKIGRYIENRDKTEVSSVVILNFIWIKG